MAKEKNRSFCEGGGAPYAKTGSYIFIINNLYWVYPLKNMIVFRGGTPIFILWLSEYYMTKSRLGVPPYRKNFWKKWLGLLHKPFICPLEAIPTRYEDSTADVFIEHKGKPHSDKSETEHNTEKIAETYVYKPLYDDSEIEWEEDIARCSKCVCSPDIDALTDLKQYIHPETPAYEGGDFLIIREWISDEWAA